MPLLFLSQEDVIKLGISMKEVIDAVEEGFRLKGLGQVDKNTNKYITF